MAGAWPRRKTGLKEAPAILVTEPTGFDIIHKEKGQLQLALGTVGEACHSSMPQLGDNAIAKMVEILRTSGTAAHSSESDDRHDPLDDDDKGGTRINVIPDHARRR